MAVESLPMDEDHPVTPRDPYALGKRTVEVQADGFGRRSGSPTSVATFRLPFVADPDLMREHFVEPDRTLEGIGDGSWVTRDDLFAYVGRTDAARALRRGIETDLGGHETFFLSARDTTMTTPTPEIIERCYSEADADPAAFDEYESVVDTGKAERLLGWEPRQSWRDLDPGRVAEVGSADRRQVRE
ncbi:MAG: NAD-dependent epimerase/dehydratase family protein [Halosimplex sp.]